MPCKLLFGLIGIAVLGIGMSSSVVFNAFAGAAPCALDTLVEPNSCVIHCPKGSAYSSLAGAVGCAEGTTAVCQCGDPTRRIAYCEIRRP